MLVRMSLYKLYLRVAMYAVPWLALVAALVIRSFFHGGTHFHPGQHLQVLLLVTPMWAATAEWYRLTSVSQLLKERTGASASGLACAVTYTCVIVVLFLVQQFSISRFVIAVSAFLTFLLTVLFRFAVRSLIIRAKSPKKDYRTLIVGTDRFARKVAWQLSHIAISSVEIAGYVHLPGQSVAVNGRVFELENLAEARRIKGLKDVVIAVPPEYFPGLPYLKKSLDELCLPVRAVVDFGRDMVFQEEIIQIGQLHMLNLASTPAESVRYVLLKRIFDIAFSISAIVATAPIMAAIAVAVRLSSPGPVVFRQDRVGLNGTIFSMYKFRTMKMSSGHEGDTVWTIKDDPRRTRLGTFLRKTSLDELPQFFNVLRGEMSVVGPRPERPYFVEQFREHYSQYDRRHRLKVGITGWAQVNGLRGDTSIPKRVEYDLYYLRNWSMSLDLRIVLMTFLSGLVNRNAY